MSKCKNTYQLNSEQGFTLVEILLSLLIILIMVMAFVPMFELIAKTIESNKSKQTATALANSVMEEMRALPYIVKDPNTGLIVTDPDVLQLGIKGGNPPGSIPATQERRIDGKTYTINTRIHWVTDDGNPIAYKKVKVSIECSSAFKGDVVVTSDFYTLAAQEGEAEVFDAGHIAVNIRDKNGNRWESPEIVINVISEENNIDELSYTEYGETLFGVIPAGNYIVTAKLPTELVARPDQKIDAGLVIKENVEVTNTFTEEVDFFIDYPAHLSLLMKDELIENYITGNGSLELKWEEKRLPSITFTKSDFSNNRLSSEKIGGLWPSGSYSISLSDVMDSETYKAYYSYNMAEEGAVQPRSNGAEWNGSLGAYGSTTNVVVDLKSALKTHLIAKENSLETEEFADEEGNILRYVTKWEDQSGYGHNARQTNVGESPLLELSSNHSSIKFNGSESLIINYPDYPVSACVDNFTIFIVTKPSDTITTYDEPKQSGVQGAEHEIYTNRYLFWPDHGGDHSAGQGISLGTNGLCNFEHGSNYMPPTAVYTGNISNSIFTTIGIKYEAKKPYIYMNNSNNLIAIGLESLRDNVYSPNIIGGGDYGHYSGELAEIMIYDLSLSDVNMAIIYEYLGEKY